MSGVTTLTKLERLRRLRQDVDTAIAAEEQRLRGCLPDPEVVSTALEHRSPAFHTEEARSAVSASDVRAWARLKHMPVPERGPVSAVLVDAYLDAHAADAP